jgi:hypothetical protein
MPVGKNPDSPPYLTMADARTIREDMDSKDLDYIHRFISETFEAQLVARWRKGETTVKESDAKEQNKTETPMNIVRTFIILVEQGKVSGPEGGRKKLYKINAEWAAEEAVRQKVQEEKENKEGEERARKASLEAKKKKEEAEEHKRALQEIRGNNTQEEVGDVRQPPAKKAKKVSEQTALFTSDDLMQPPPGPTLEEVRVPQSGINPELMEEVTNMLTILLDGADDGLLVEKALEQCQEEQISPESFFRVLQWMHDQNHLFVDIPDGAELSCPQCIIYSV